MAAYRICFSFHLAEAGYRTDHLLETLKKEKAMFLLNHIKPEEASGKVAEAYSVFPSQVPVPELLILMSASPELAYAQSGIIRHFMSHDRLDMGLLAMIRYLVANEYDYQFCIDFNAGLLKRAGGMSDTDLDALKANPENAPLEESQKALLLFVLKVVRTPNDVEKSDVDKLRELGWSDKDIFDAAYHGAAMIGPSTLFKAFTE
jgi:alkylhydroperoxidase family enzyme